jgi:hypothetical protein
LHPPVHPLWVELEAIINQAVEKSLYGGDPETVLAAAKTEYGRILATFNARRRAVPEGLLAPREPAVTRRPPGRQASGSDPQVGGIDPHAPGGRLSGRGSDVLSGGPDRPQGSPARDLPWSLVLLGLIAVGTVLNAVLLYFVLREIKKNP